MPSFHKGIELTAVDEVDSANLHCSRSCQGTDKKVHFGNSLHSGDDKQLEVPGDRDDEANSEDSDDELSDS